jgi:HK97 family phage major capsid protein
MSTMLEFKSLLDKQGEALEGFMTRHNAALDSLKAQLEGERKEREGLEARINRGGIGAITTKEGNIDARELKEDGDALRAYIKSGDLTAIKSMSVGSDPEGGYTVYPSLSAAMTKRIFETSPLRRLARVVTIGSDAFEELLDLNEPEVGWVG